MTPVTSAETPSNSQVSAPATAGDVLFDLGDDSDTLNELTISGTVAASRDVLIYKLPQTDFSAVVGISQTVSLTPGNLVRVTTGNRPAVYEYIGAIVSMDLGSATYSNTLLWRETSVNPTNTGQTVVAVTGAGTLTAGRDIDIWTGGGDDSIAVASLLKAQRDVRIQTGNGTEVLVKVFARLFATNGCNYVLGKQLGLSNSVLCVWHAVTSNTTSGKVWYCRDIAGSPSTSNWRLTIDDLQLGVCSDSHASVQWEGAILGNRSSRYTCGPNDQI